MSSYASATTDLPNYVNPAVFGAQVTLPQQQAALDSRSSEADGYFSRYAYAYGPPGYGVGGSLPAPYDPSLVRAICHLAIWDLLFGIRGANPQAGADDNYKTNMLLALEWLKKISRQEVQLVNVPVPQSGSAPGASPLVLSDPQQGFIPGPYGSSAPPWPSGIN